MKKHTLTKWIEDKGITRREAARICCCSPAMISLMEHGERWPSRAMALAIQEATKGACQADKLLGINSKRKEERIMGRKLGSKNKPKETIATTKSGSKPGKGKGKGKGC